MDSDKQSPAAKNGKPRRVSALQKVAGSIPEGKDVGSSLDDFIATANQTMTEMDGWTLTTEAKAAKAKEEAPAPPVEAPVSAQTTAEVARVAAEEAARRVLAEVSKKSEQQMAQLEEKLAKAEARASSAELQVRQSGQFKAARAQSSPVFEPTPEDSFGGQPFSFADKPRGSSGLIKGIAIVGAAALVAGGVFFVGDGRLWNKKEESKTAAAVQATPVAAAQPAVEAPPPAAPAVTPLPPAEEAPSAAPAARETAKSEAVVPATAEPAKVEPAPAQPVTTPLVTSLAPTVPPSTALAVTPLDDEPDASNSKKTAKTSKKKAKSKKSSKKPASSKSESKKPAGGIVDPFAQ